MATYTIIKLKEMSPLHVGTGKENYDFSASILHSDTLSAALAAMRVRLGRSADVADFMDSFTLTSAFPYMGNRYFLPRPCGRVAVSINDCDEYVSRKKIKSIRFIESTLWNQLIEGKKVTVVGECLKDGFLLAGNDKGRFEQPYKASVNQRVSIPREDGADAEPFFFDWTYFRHDAGLYCLTDAEGALLDEIVSLFEVLGEYGIGTDKNVGGGKFAVETDKMNFSEVSNTDTVVSLSLYIPHEEDISLINLSESHFELVQRGGYMAGSEENDFWHLRKKSIYALGVGAIIKTSGKRKGKIVDLRPTEYNDERMHPVYRSGKPFVLPINMEAL